MIDLLNSNGKFYKANLHCHTIVSDGGMTPEQVKDYYQKHGYSIVAFTDHNKFVLHDDLKDANFLPIAGFEADFHILTKEGVPSRLRTCHLNFFAKNPETAVHLPEPVIYHHSLINGYIKDMVDNGWLCMLNHPTWSLQPTDEVVAIDNITAMEVYNHGCQVLSNNGDSQGYYASYLASGKKAFATATDDNHCALLEDGLPGGNNDACGGYIMISMKDFSYESFIDSFEKGRFYASTGVEIKELYIDEQADELVISCSPVKAITIKGATYLSTPNVYSRKDDITSARMPMNRIRKLCPNYFRVEFMTSDGKRAYSQPYYYENK